jgi:hypothetical protein
VALLGVFVALTLFSSHFELMASVWVYYLLFLEALEVGFMEVSVQCFAGAAWCGGEAKYQLSVLVLLAAFVAVVLLRAQCYCPFQDGSNPLSMYIAPHAGTPAGQYCSSSPTPH